MPDSRLEAFTDIEVIAIENCIQVAGLAWEGDEWGSADDYESTMEALVEEWEAERVKRVANQPSYITDPKLIAAVEDLKNAKNKAERDAAIKILDAAITVADILPKLEAVPDEDDAS